MTALIPHVNNPLAPGGTMEEQVCNVKQRVDTWPYITRCREVATHVVVKHLVDQVDATYLCNDHAADLKLAYGEDACGRFSYSVNLEALERHEVGS